VLGGKKTRTSVSNSTMSLYCVVAFLCSGPVLVRLVRGGVAASQSVFLLCVSVGLARDATMAWPAQRQMAPPPF
jgi:hypothetical protein